MSIKARVKRLESRRASRLRVLLESDAAAQLARSPKRPGEVIVILGDDAEDL